VVCVKNLKAENVIFFSFCLQEKNVYQLFLRKKIILFKSNLKKKVYFMKDFLLILIATC